MEPAFANPSDYRGRSCFDAWARLLQVPAGDRRDAFRRIGIVLELPDVIEQEIRSIPDCDHDRYLSWVPGVKKPFYDPNLAAQFATCLNAFDENVRNLIWICSDQLSRLRPQPFVDEDALGALHKSAQDLLSSISGSDLPEHLRQFIMRQMEIVERAIGDYRLQGISAIQVGVEAAAGMMVCQRDVLEEVRATPKGTDMWTILQRFAHVSTITSTGVKLLEFIQERSIGG